MNKYMKMKKVILFIAIFSPLMFGAFSCVSNYRPIAGLNASKTGRYGNKEKIFNKNDIKLIASIIDQFLTEYGFQSKKEEKSNWLAGNNIKLEYIFYDTNKNMNIICNVNIDRKSIGIGFLTYRENVQLFINDDSIRNLNTKIKDRLRIEYKYLPIFVYSDEVNK